MRSRGEELVRVWNLSAFSTENDFLLASSVCDQQHAVERFVAEFELVGFRISTSMSEEWFFAGKRVGTLSSGFTELMPQAEEFNYFGVLFTTLENGL